MIEIYKKYFLQAINNQPFYSEIFLIILGFFFILVILSFILVNLVSIKKKETSKERLLQLEKKLMRLKKSNEIGEISNAEYKNRVKVLINNIKIVL